MSQCFRIRVMANTVGMVCLVLAAAFPIFARASHSQSWAQEQFDAAETARESLQALPESDRTRRDYERAIDAYRRVYFGAPTSTKADASVVAAADLMADEGRRFHDGKLLRAAVDEYEFLRREYPGSKNRVEALFNIGQIYKDDLDDPDQARANFEEFVHRYPHHHLAVDAQQELKEIAKQAAEKDAANKQALARQVNARVKTSHVKTRLGQPPAQRTSEPETEDSPPAPADSKHGKLARVTGVEHWSSGRYTLVAIDLEQAVKFDSQRIENPDRIFFDLYGAHLASTLSGKTFDVDNGFLKRIRVAQYQPSQARVVLELTEVSDYHASLQSDPPRLVIQLSQQTGTGTAVAAPQAGTGTAPANQSAIAAIPRKIVEADDFPAVPRTLSSGKWRPNRTIPQKVSADADPPPAETLAGSTSGKRKAADGNNDEIATLDPASAPLPKRTPALNAKAGDAPAVKKGKHSKMPAPDAGHEAQPTASGERSLIRALGLKIGRIVIDPGHGGHDTGTIGPNGLQEKDLVLDVAKRLGRLLETRLGAEVVYTREYDTFIPLETRTAIANREQADLFVSIHANSSPDADARGVETYYLNFTSSRDALEVAARENAVSEKTIYELQDLVKKIALKEKIDESREFAGDVENSLHAGLAAKSPAIRDRGVKKAPFIVLIGANMPSILSEISFVSNPTDERKLGTPDYRQRIAEALYRGIAKYVEGLSGVKVASRGAHSEGQ